ncbi:hypothetical protein NB723_003411 [Xanthomonas sacchari]|nr:hypothetical protein [Xanthomonas sacchari]
MAMAGAAAAAGAVVGGVDTGRRGGSLQRRQRQRHRRHGTATDAHVQRFAVQPHLQPPRRGGAQAQVHVVPEHHRVAVALGQGAGNHLGVAMPLDDLQPLSQRRVVDRIGHLAQATADRRHQAALAQFAAGDEAAAAGGAAELAPETEGRPGRHLHAVQRTRGQAQVVDLAGHQLRRGLLAVGPQRGDGFGTAAVGDRQAGIAAMPARTVAQIVQRAAQLQRTGLGPEQQAAPARRQQRRRRRRCARLHCRWHERASSMSLTALGIALLYGHAGPALDERAAPFRQRAFRRIGARATARRPPRRYRTLSSFSRSWSPA